MVRNNDRETEINEFDHPRSLFNQYIIKLDISMYCVDRMKIMDWLSNLFEYTPCSYLSYCAIAQGLHILLKRNSFDEIRYNVDLLRSIDQIMQPDYTRILETFEHSDLSLGSFPLHWIRKFIFFVNFHSILSLVSLVET